VDHPPVSLYGHHLGGSRSSETLHVVTSWHDWGRKYVYGESRSIGWWITGGTTGAPEPFFQHAERIYDETFPPRRVKRRLLFSR
jgi:hypothetical protein